MEEFSSRVELEKFFANRQAAFWAVFFFCPKFSTLIRHRLFAADSGGERGKGGTGIGKTNSRKLILIRPPAGK